MGRTMRRWLLTLGLLGSLTAHAGSPVWALHGEHNTVYLAGSVHLLRANDAALPAAFERAYAGSRALVMELDLGKLDQLEAGSWMMAHGTLPDGSSLRKVVGEERYRRVTAEADRLGLPMEAADRQTPWAIGLELLELQYMQLGFDPEQGVEQQLERRAQTDGKPTSGLETVTEQLGVFETLSPEDQARFLDLVVTEMHEVESETRSVVAAWRTGDARKLAALLGDEYKSFPTLYRTLVTDRNRRWLPQIEKLLKDKDNYLVVVGALHLVGDGGLLELMRKDGFAAEALN